MNSDSSKRSKSYLLHLTILISKRRPSIEALSDQPLCWTETGGYSTAVIIFTYLYDFYIKRHNSVCRRRATKCSDAAVDTFQTETVNITTTYRYTLNKHICRAHILFIEYMHSYPGMLHPRPHRQLPSGEIAVKCLSINK